MPGNTGGGLFTVGTLALKEPLALVKDSLEPWNFGSAQVSLPTALGTPAGARCAGALPSRSSPRTFAHDGGCAGPFGVCGWSAGVPVVVAGCAGALPSRLSPRTFAHDGGCAGPFGGCGWSAGVPVVVAGVMNSRATTAQPFGGRGSSAGQQSCVPVVVAPCSPRVVAGGCAGSFGGRGWSAGLCVPVVVAPCSPRLVAQHATSVAPRSQRSS